MDTLSVDKTLLNNLALEISNFPEISLNELTNERLDFISSKLSSLINSPYYEAVHFLKINNIEKCKEKLLLILTDNSFNLPALLLYIYILIYEKKYELAICYYWEMFQRFTYRYDLFPSELYTEFEDYILNIKLYKTKFAIKSDNSFNKIKKLGLSPYFIATSWGNNNAHFFKKSLIKCYDWKKNNLQVSSKNLELILVTIKYIILKDKDSYYIYDSLENRLEESYHDISMFYPKNFNGGNSKLYNKMNINILSSDSSYIMFKNVKIDKQTSGATNALPNMPKQNPAFNSLLTKRNSSIKTSSEEIVVTIL